MTYTKKIIIIEHRLQQTLSLTQKLSNQLSTTKTHSLTTHLNSATMFTDFNFTTFNIYNLNKVEKEMLISKMKVEQVNESFEMELNKEKVSMILNEINNNNDELKQQIYNFINSQDKMEVVSDIIKSNDDIKQMIANNYDELSFLLGGDFDIEYSNEYILIIINYNMFYTQKSIEEINKSIASIKNISELLNQGETVYHMNKTYFKRRGKKNVKQINEEQLRMIVDREIIDLVQKITKTEDDLATLTIYLNEDRMEENKIYIHLTNEVYEAILNIVRNATDISYDLVHFLENINKYFFDKTDKYVSDDLLFYLFSRMEKESTITQKQKVYFYGEIAKYLNKFSVNSIANFKGNFSYYIKNIESVNTEEVKSIVQKYNEVVANEFVLIKSQKNTENKIVSEILKTCQLIKLQSFVKSLFDEQTYKYIITNLRKYQVESFDKLKEMIEEKQFIKFACSSKFLNKSQIKKILSAFLKINFKLKSINDYNIPQDKNILTSKDIIIAGEMKSTKSQVSLCEKYEMKLNLSVMKSITTDESLIKTIDEQMKTIDEQIKQIIISTDEVSKLEDQLLFINECVKNATTQQDISSVKKITSIIQSKISSIRDNKYGNNFEKEEVSKFSGVTDNFKMTKLIDQYEKIFNEEEKQIKKNIDKEQHINNIKTIINSIIADFDAKYNKQTSVKSIENIIAYILANKYQLIKKLSSMRKNKKISFTNFVQVNTERIVKIFVSIIYFKMYDINVNEIYTYTQSKTYENKSVYVKSLDMTATFVAEVDGKYVVSVSGEMYTFEKDDCEMINTLLGKNVKVIKGQNKGLYGTVFDDKVDYVLITKDTYGKNRDLSQEMPSLQWLKLNKDSIKVLEEKYQYASSSNDVNFHNKEIFNFFNKKINASYPIAKYTYFMTLDESITTFKMFDFLYKQAQQMVISFLNKVEETNKTIKDDKINIVKKMKLLNKVKDNKMKYLKLKKNIDASKTNLKLKVIEASNNKIFNNISMTETTDFTQYKQIATIKPVLKQEIPVVDTIKYVSQVNDFLASL